MVNSTKYGRVTSSEKAISEDEPVFLLRGQDEFAAATVIFYTNLLLENGYREDYISPILEQAEQMRRWPVKKRPD